MNDRMTSIDRKLRAIRLRDAVHTPLPEAELVAFEEAHGVRLPDDYRAFLAHIGSVGAGPDYGLVGLAGRPMPEGMPSVTTTITGHDGEILASAGTGERPPLVARVPIVARAFPLEAPYAPVDENGNLRPPPVAGDSHLYDGCLFLTEIGCGYFHFLVVSGPRRGEVWADYTAGDGSIYPVAGSFLEFYEYWLNGYVRAELANEVRQALFNRQPRCERHDDVVALQPVFVRDLDDARVSDAELGDYATISIYLGNRDIANAVLSALEKRQNVHPQMMAAITEWLYGEAFAKARANPPDVALVDHPKVRVRETLAANPACPLATAIALARDAISVRLALVERPEAPIEVLRAVVDATLADPAERSRDAEVQLDFVGRHPTSAADPALLERLAAASPIAARAVAANLRASHTLLERLACHDEPAVRHAVAMNRHAGAALLARLARDPHPRVREGVAKNPAITEEIVALVAGPDLDVAIRASERPSEAQVALAANPRTPRAWLERFAAWMVYEIQSALEHNPALPDDLEDLVKRNPWSASAEGLHKQDIAARRGEVVVTDEDDDVDDPEEVDETRDAVDEDLAEPFVRRAEQYYGNHPWASLREVAEHRVFHHPTYPVAWIDEVARVTNADGRDMMDGYGAAQHPFLTDALYRQLAQHGYSCTRSNLLAHANLPDDVLAQLLADPVVAQAAFRHPRVDARRVGLDHAQAHDRAMATMSNDMKMAVAAAAAPWCPAPLLERLARDDERWVWRNALTNPRAPLAVVEALAQDADPEVRKWAAVAPQLTEATLRRLLDDDNDVVWAWASYRARRDALFR
jgi:hypothetical protein